MSNLTQNNIGETEEGLIQPDRPSKSLKSIQVHLTNLNLLQSTISPSFDQRIRQDGFNQVSYILSEDKLSSLIKQREHHLKLRLKESSQNQQEFPQKSKEIQFEFMQTRVRSFNFMRMELSFTEKLETEGEKMNKKASAGISYLQKLGRKLKHEQIDHNNETKQNLNQSQISTSRSHSSSITKIEGDEFNYQKVEQQPQILDPIVPHDSQNIHSSNIQTVRKNQKISTSSQTSRRRKSFVRQGSSFEKTLCVSFVKKSSKFQTVENLIHQAKHSQWAFDFKPENISGDQDQAEEFQRSLIQFQKLGLKNIANNLNQLNKQLEFQKSKENSLHQKSSTMHILPTQQIRPLQLKIRKCEIQQESLSDINQIGTPQEFQISKPEIKYSSNRNYRKFTSHENDDQSSLSCTFSDAISSTSNKNCKRTIKISETSMKGIFRNLRKLTQDIMQSDDTKSLSQYLDSSISCEKISPTLINSIERRSKFLTVNEELKQIDESIMSYSTNENERNRRVHFSLGKGVEVDSFQHQYKSNENDDSARFRNIIKDIPIKQKSSNSSTEINFTNIQKTSDIRRHLPSKHKSSLMPVKIPHNILLNVPVHQYQPHSANQNYEKQKNESFNSKSLDCNQSTAYVQESISCMAGGFDFDTKDDLMNDEGDMFDSVRVTENQENKNSFSNFRKFTYDESNNKTPILPIKPSRKQNINQQVHGSLRGYYNSQNHTNNNLQQNEALKSQNMSFTRQRL